VEAGVNRTLARERAQILGDPDAPAELASAGHLLVAARMLHSAAEDEMTATTVVGVLGDDDIDAFRALVQEIAQDFDLEASVKLKPGSFSIRFSRAHADGRRMSA
jgi:hypothetical protein